MSALHREIKRLLAEYNRTEPIGAVEALVLREHPELALFSPDQWALADHSRKQCPMVPFGYPIVR